MVIIASRLQDRVYPPSSGRRTTRCQITITARLPVRKSIQAQLGHASIQTTLDRYGHLLPEVHNQAAERLEKPLLGENYSSKLVVICPKYENRILRIAEKIASDQVFCWCPRGDLNPYRLYAHKALNLARLPVPPLGHSKLVLLREIYYTCSDFASQFGLGR